MDYYIELRILPDPEFLPNVLMNALYSKLHKALVKMDSNDIGISFPHYQEKQNLGERIKLHGNKERLEALMNTNWLQGMRDYVLLGSINQIPIKIQHAIFSRSQVKSNIERIRRRQVRRHGFTEQEISEKIPASLEKRSDLPFVNLKSHSTQQTFRLFIKKEDVPEKKSGHFNTYGLSNEASVPIF